MFELSNAQRKCFGLVPVMANWERIEAKAGPYDQYRTFLYLDSTQIVKCILSGENIYCEYELSEELTPDRKYLLPKTANGKPTLLSASAVQKRKGIGMHLNYWEKNISLYNDTTECSYFSNCYLQDNIHDLTEFSHWVEEWCQETTEADIQDILRFSQMERRHVRYQEGDVFRFKINRRLYGYGRILLDYGKMRKQKEPFWDILMGKPLVCSVYHIVTDRADLSVDDLQSLSSLPSTILMDNTLYYGEYQIIGNLPVSDQEDYPILYGNSINAAIKGVFYQCGKVYRSIENKEALFHGFRNNGVSFSLNLTLDILLACINKNSNEPYWNQYYPHFVDRDLRNPKHQSKLQMIKRQFSL